MLGICSLEMMPILGWTEARSETADLPPSINLPMRVFHHTRRVENLRSTSDRRSVTKMVRAESSKDAENGVKAHTNGAPSNYELPWFACLNRDHARHLTNTDAGWRSTDLSSSTI